MDKRGVSSTRRSTSVLLPVPDGAETMKSRPRPSLDILHLLAHLLELRFRRDHELGDSKTVGLRSHRVDLAVHLLQQEVELASARLGSVDERRQVRDVAAEPRNLFADVGASR